MKRIVVQKYGGTSLQNSDRISSAAKRIVKRKRDGYRVVVVASAMGKTTDQLIKQAGELTESPSPREMDMLLSTGEQISVSLLSMAVESMDTSAISLTGSQCGIQTRGFHNRAKIAHIDTGRILDELNRDKVVIITGFQGQNDQGDITTLGRGGSDTSAVALAAALEADFCEIYTDVKGIYSTDPGKIPSAKLLDTISFDHLTELSSAGAVVMHPRSIELARKYNIPVKIRSSLEKSDLYGTTIKGDSEMEKSVLTGVALDKNIAKLSVTGVPDVPGVVHEHVAALYEQEVTVDMIIQNVNRDTVNDISFIVSSDDLEPALDICRDTVEHRGAADVLQNEEVCKLSLIGSGIMSDADIAPRFFKTLKSHGINIQMISSNSSRLSVIISENEGDNALKLIYSEFEKSLNNNNS